jgi:hypothetical protein
MDPRVRELAARGWNTDRSIRAAVKQIKRAEATVRDAATPPERRRQYRLAQERGASS